VETQDKNVELLQKDMWQISGRLADNNKIDLKKRIKWLETSINGMEKKLAVLKNFVVPGINRKEAICQICRSVSRRAERSLWKLNKYIKVDKDVLVYFNRLSDYLFILSRRLT
jgi:cob(I)alamin adenosyltransferase